MNRRSFLRLLGLAPIAAPVAAAGMAQAGYATGGVLPAGQFIFGEMATGSLVPLHDGRRIPVALRQPSELVTVTVTVTVGEGGVSGPIRPVIAPDEAQRSEAFRGLVERGSVEEQPQ